MAALELPRPVPHAGQEAGDGEGVEADRVPGEQLVHQRPRKSHQAVPEEGSQGEPAGAVQERGGGGVIMIDVLFSFYLISWKSMECWHIAINPIIHTYCF